MKSAGSERVEERALIWAVGRDGALTCDFLTSAGFEALSVPNCNEMCREIERGAGVLVLASEVLTDPDSDVLRELLRQQPAWSDIPVVVVAGRSRGGANLPRTPSVINTASGFSYHVS